MSQQEEYDQWPLERLIERKEAWGETLAIAMREEQEAKQKTVLCEVELRRIEGAIKQREYVLSGSPLRRKGDVKFKLEGFLETHKRKML